MIHVVLISILAYSICYCIFNKLIKICYFKRTEQETIKFSKKECSYVDSLHISLIHASVCIILGFAGLIIYDNDIWRPMNRLEEIAIAQSFGYMIYDSILLYLLGELDLFVIWHHLGCITTILIFWLDGYGTCILMFNMSMGEITHPFHFTQIIFSMKNEPKDSKRYLTNLLIFTTMFITIRLPLSSIVNYPVMFLKDYSIYKKLIIIPCLALCIDWCIQAFLKSCKILPFLKEKEIKNYKGLQRSLINSTISIYKALERLKDKKFYEVTKNSILFGVPAVISLVSSII